MDQRKLEDIGHLVEAAAARQQLRTAYRKELFGAQSNGIKSGPIAIAMAHRKVDLLAREVDVVQRRGYTKINFGVRFGKVPKPMHKPFGGEVRRGTDGENARALPLKKPLGTGSNAVQRITYDGEVIAACLRNDESLAFAIEKFDRKFGFERLDLVAHRALRDAKLFGSAREALMPSRGFKRFQGIQWWQARTHRGS